MKFKLGLILLLSILLTACTTDTSPTSTQMTTPSQSIVPTSPSIESEASPVPVSARMFEWALSPDGRIVAGVAGTDCTQNCPPGEVCDCLDYGLYICDVIEGEVNNESCRLLPIISASPRNPFWSPDGRVIGFEAGNSEEVWSIDIYEEKSKFLADGISATWSPDAQRVAVAEMVSTEIEQGFVINIIDIATGQTETVLQGIGSVSKTAGMAWSPDGRYIAFVWDETPERALWESPLLLDLNTLDVTPLFSQEVFAVEILGWTDDGEWLVVSGAEIGGVFIHRDEICHTVPSALADLTWYAFSGPTAELLVSGHEETLIYRVPYTIDLLTVLGADFPEGSLSCPNP